MLDWPSPLPPKKWFLDCPIFVVWVPSPSGVAPFARIQTRHPQHTRAPARALLTSRRPICAVGDTYLTLSASLRLYRNRTVASRHHGPADITRKPQNMASQRVISLAEVKRHNKRTDAWTVVHGRVYDLTKFAPEHPGGAHIMYKVAGRDGTRIFDTIHQLDIFDGYKDAVPQIGVLNPKDLAKLQAKNKKKAPKRTENGSSLPSTRFSTRLSSRRSPGGASPTPHTRTSVRAPTMRSRYAKTTPLLAVYGSNRASSVMSQTWTSPRQSSATTRAFP